MPSRKPLLRGTKSETRPWRKRKDGSTLIRRELSGLVGSATVSFGALSAARVASGGAAAAVFREFLVEMRSFLDNPKWVAQ